MLIARSSSKEDVVLLPKMANRHGLITGATGTGKTVTLQKMAESFSNIGVPVFMADIKGDLTGISQKGEGGAKLLERLGKIGITDWQADKSPVELWDIYAEAGAPIRSTISSLGPLLLTRLLNLSDVQAGVLQIIFKYADDNGLLLLDLKDLRSMAQFLGDNVNDIKLTYGNATTASIGAIQRGLLTLEQEGATNFFGEPMLDIQDLIKCNEEGKGIVNILSAVKLFQSPKLYSITLLWILSELYETLPEVGDLEKPKLVFFFDEAHMLFKDIPKALLDKIEQVVRLVRSKGVGVYFVTQNPTDVPDIILGQLGNRVQHALRAYSPKDQKAVKVAAQTMRANPEFNTETVIQELGTGEALISFLDAKGTPSIVQKSSVIAPNSRMGLASDSEKEEILRESKLYSKYSKPLDRESAYEILLKNTKATAATDDVKLSKHGKPSKPSNKKEDADKSEESVILRELKEVMLGSTGPRGGKKDGLLQKTMKSAGKEISNSIEDGLGRRIVRGVLGSILKKK